MSDLNKIMSTDDFISIRNIKQAYKQIYPLILNLINATIQTLIYPDNTKISKIKPVPKDNANPMDTLSW